MFKKLLSKAVKRPRKACETPEYLQAILKGKRERRAEAALQRRTEKREGACEEVVHKMVGGIIKRLLQRRRSNDSKTKNPNRLKGGASRAAAWHAAKKEEAKKRGITITALLKERRKAHAEKTPSYFNRSMWHKNRIKTDVAYKTKCNLRTRLGEFLRLHNGTKAAGTMVLVGCSQKQLIQHLEKQLVGETSTLINYSVDHIFPMSMYDASDPQQQRQMMHFSNLQPLPLYGTNGNVSKSNNLPSLELALKVERWAWPPGVSESDLGSSSWCTFHARCCKHRSCH